MQWRQLKERFMSFASVVRNMRGYNLPTDWFVTFVLAAEVDGEWPIMTDYPLTFNYAEPDAPWPNQAELFDSTDDGQTWGPIPSGHVIGRSAGKTYAGGIFNICEAHIFTVGGQQVGFALSVMHENTITAINAAAVSDPANANAVVIAADPVIPSASEHPSLDHSTPYTQAQVNTISGWLTGHSVNLTTFAAAMGFASPAALGAAMQANPKADIAGDPPGIGSFCGRVYAVFAEGWSVS
jgi:hypothetical protein